MRYTRFALTTGRPSRLTPVAAAPHTAITIRRQVSHRHVYPGQYGGIVRTGLPSAILSVRWPVNPNAQLRTRHAKTSANVAYSSFPATRAHAQSIFARPNSTASLSISASIVFCPEGAGVREFAYWRQRVRRPAPLPRPMQQPSVNRLNIACAI